MSQGTAPTVNPQFLPPDLPEFIQRRMRDISSNINACLIGTITAINANGTITAAVSFQKIIKGIVPLGNGVMGDQIVNYPALVNVPIFVYQGGGAYISMPIAIKDPCILLFCDRDMDTWFESGQIGPPNSDRLHSINDAIAIVGINNLQNLLPITPNGLIQVVDKTGERLPPSGAMMAYGGSAAPSGWLLCQGQSVLRATYPNLFAVIGTTFGSVDGTHFTLPNMQGQVPVGIGGTLGLTLGQEFGEVTHLLTGPESGIQAHSHIIDAGNTGSGGAIGNGDWTPSPYTNTETTGPTNAQSAHNNIQPSLGVQWIIKI